MKTALLRLIFIAVYMVCRTGAETIEVTTTIDEFDTPSGASMSLREAVRDSQTGDTITFSPTLSGSTIRLTNGEITLTESITIDSSDLDAPITISGDDSTLIFDVADDVTATFRSLSLTEGSGTSGAAVRLGEDANLVSEQCVFHHNTGNAIHRFSAGNIHCSNCSFIANEGGSIIASGTGARNVSLVACTFVGNVAGYSATVYVSAGGLHIERCLFSGNQSSSRGGALHSANLTAVVVDSTFIHNTASRGGAIMNEGHLSLTNCTIANNTAKVEGGGLKSVVGSLTLNHVTIAGNIARDEGGGLWTDADVTLQNTLIADNTCVLGDTGDVAGTGATITRSGSNLVGNPNSVEAAFPTGLPNTNGDYVGSADSPLHPLLAPLGDYGGDFPCRPPLAGSDAIDKVTSTLTPDQRGLARPQGVASDIGAAEWTAGDGDHFPPDGTDLVTRRPLLIWGDTPGATSYELFLGEDPDALVSVAVTSGNHHRLTDLPPATTHYWRIDSTLDETPVTGPTHSFTTRADLRVDTPDDTTDPADGQTSLREALDAAELANGWDRIEFAPSISGAVILLGELALSISNHDLHVDAANLPQGPTLSSNHPSPLLSIGLTAKVEMTNIGITLTATTSNTTISSVNVGRGARLHGRNCRWIDNAGIGLTSTDSILILEDCRFERNREGCRLNGDSTIKRCVFRENHSGATTSSGSTNRLTDCEFVGHTSLIEHSSSVALRMSATTTVERCLFTQNEGTAVSWNGRWNTDDRGDIIACVFRDNPGAGIVSSSSNRIHVAGCSFERNLEGAIQGDCNVSDSIFTGNYGGAVGANGAEITNCFFGSNTSTGSGGAIKIDRGSITNCTFVGNRAAIGGAIFADSDTDCHHLTITNNQATESGGGISFTNAGDGEFTGCVVAGNRAPIHPDIRRTSANTTPTTRNSPNLIGNNQGSEALFPVSPAPGTPNADGNLVGSLQFPLNPHLSPSGDFGGPTPSVLPLPGSPAIDRADPAQSPSTDQRGIARPHGTAADLGATELDASTAAFFPANTQTNASLHTSLRWITDPTNGPFTVMMGPAPDDLSSVGTVNTGSFSADLDPSTTYYWQIVPSTGEPGPVQSFTTRDDIVVTTALDAVDAGDGLTSLREAISLAADTPGFDRIIFDPSLRDQTITVASQITVEFSDLSIDASAHAVPQAISGDNTTRIFHAKDACVLSLHNMRIANGAATDGGAILAEGLASVVLAQCELSANTAEKSGGAITLRTHAFLAAHDSEFLENSAENGGAIALIETSGPLTLDNCRMHSNQAESEGGALWRDAPSFSWQLGDPVPIMIDRCQLTGNTAKTGGAIHLEERVLFSMTHSHVHANTATGFGGGLYSMDDWTPDDGRSAHRIAHCSFTANTASNGGGLYLSGTALEATNLTISGNLADEGSGAVTISGTCPGPVIRHATIVGNSSGVWFPTDPAGAVTIGSTTPPVIQNSIIANNNGDLDIILDSPNGSTISGGGNLIGNNDGIEDAFPLPSSPHAMNLNGDFVGSPETPLDALLQPLVDNGGLGPTHLPLSGSLAIDAIPGGLVADDQRGVARPQGTASDIGAVEMEPSASYFTPNGTANESPTTDLSWLFRPDADHYEIFLGPHPDAMASIGTSETGRMSAPLLDYNTSYHWRINAIVGGQIVSSPTLAFDTRPRILVDTNSSTVDPEDNLTSLPEAMLISAALPGIDAIRFAPHLAGQTIDLDGPLAAQQEPLDIDASDLATPVTISGGGGFGSLLSLKEAEYSIAGITFLGGAGSARAAIKATPNATLHISDCEFSGYTEPAINASGPALQVMHCQFTNNLGWAAITYGGSALQVVACQFTDNSGGSAIKATGGDHVIRQTLFHQNSGGSGGAIYVKSDSLECTDCEFRSNSSSGSGGAIYSGSTKMAIDDCMFSANEALPGSGGAIYASGGQATISNSQFTSNVATSVAGAVYSSGKIDIERCHFTGNQASYNGGAFYVDRLGTAEIRDTLFSGNQSQRDGGALFHHSEARLQINRCAFLLNQAARNGGALGSEFTFFRGPSVYNSTFSNNSASGPGGAANASEYTFFHCTITNNTSATSGGGLGRESTISNSIVAGNQAPIGPDIHESVSLSGYNFIGNNDSLTEQRGEEGFPNRYHQFVGTAENPIDPKLAPIGEFGSTLPSRPPLPGSPVIGAAKSSSSEFAPRDQHDLPRPFGPAPDIGAVEARPFSAFGIIDTDGDLIDDRLEPGYGMSVGTNNAADDTDGDGRSDSAELSAMTDPTDPTDFLRILSFTPSSSVNPDGNPVHKVTWKSFPGIAYTFASSADLRVFQPIADPPFIADGFETTLLIPLPPGHRFVRIRTTNAPDVSFAGLFPELDANADANKNGISNYLDYATGSDPAMPHDPQQSPTLRGSLLTYRHRTNASDVFSTLQKSVDLVDWTPMIESVDYELISIIRNSIHTEITLRILRDPSENPALFYRDVLSPSP